MFANASMNSIAAETVISQAMRSNESKNRKSSAARRRATENIGIQVADLADLESLEDERSDFTEQTVHGGEVTLDIQALQRGKSPMRS